MDDFAEDTNNLYVIRHRLADLTKPAYSSCFHYYVGSFIVKIFTTRVRDHNFGGSDERITHYDVVDINLVEIKRFAGGDGATTEEFINLEKDTRFKDYKPIKYKEWAGYSDGREMPIEHLCELVKYLHRLSNLSAFM